MECLFGDDCPFHSVKCALCEIHERQFKIENWVLQQEKDNPSFYVLDPQGKKYNISKAIFLLTLKKYVITDTQKIFIYNENLFLKI